MILGPGRVLYCSIKDLWCVVKFLGSLLAGFQECPRVGNPRSHDDSLAFHYQLPSDFDIVRKWLQLGRRNHKADHNGGNTSTICYVVHGARILVPSLLYLEVLACSASPGFALYEFATTRGIRDCERRWLGFSFVGVLPLLDGSRWAAVTSSTHTFVVFGRRPTFEAEEQDVNYQ